MTIIKVSIEIRQPVGKVFTYVTDIKKLPEWESNTEETEQTSEGPTGVGATRRGVDRLFGPKMPWTSKITEYESDKRCCEIVTSGSLRMEVQLTFEPTDVGTKFTQVYDLEIEGFLKLMSPVIVNIMRKQMKKNLINLKEILEA